MEEKISILCKIETPPKLERKLKFPKIGEKISIPPKIEGKVKRLFKLPLTRPSHPAMPDAPNLR